MPEYIKAGDDLIHWSEITRANIENIENGSIEIQTIYNEVLTCHGFDAIEAVMILKPSALEGRRMFWKRNAWAFHNMVGHPVTQILAWLGFKKEAVRFHDWTTPTPRDFKK